MWGDKSQRLGLLPPHNRNQLTRGQLPPIVVLVIFSPSAWCMGRDRGVARVSCFASGLSLGFLARLRLQVWVGVGLCAHVCARVCVCVHMVI